MTPLEILRRRLAELTEQRSADRTALTTLLGIQPAQLTEAQRADMGRLTEARARQETDIAALEAQIADEVAAEARAAAGREAGATSGTGPGADGGQARGAGGARVTREERTYSAEKDRRGQASFFADAYRASLGNPMAQQRLARHDTELRAEGEGVEQRATTTGSYGSLVVPQYLPEQFALVLRSGRPIANVVNRIPLPEQGMSLSIPRGTTGAAAASQATENSALQSTDEVWADLTIPVRTVGGQQDVSRQSLERGTPGLDTIIFADLARAYNAELDRQVIAGSGSSGQMTGILNTGSIGASTAYGAAATAASFYLKAAGALATVAGAGTAVQPRVWGMHPRRWYWLMAQVDSSNRPLAVPNANGPMNAMGINLMPGGYSADNDVDPPQFVGTFHGLPVIIDSNLPVNLGGTAAEDVALAIDTTQAWLWEDNGGAPRELRFEQTLPGQLTVKLVLFNYAAFTAGRYPQAFYRVGGATGDATATFGQGAPAF